jgi:4-amino-4-deoxy-L-arabinose transferase-like glycosyltransferase
MAAWMAQDAIPTRRQYALLLILLIAATAVRLATIGNPPLERTAWKEIDYLMISENYWRSGYRFLQPEVSWPAEEPRATAMELPLVPFAAAVGYAFAGQGPLSVRWPTLLAFTILGIMVFLLVRREVGPIAGLAAAAAALSMPLHHPFGQLLYSDPVAICMGAVSVFLLQRWLESERGGDAIRAVLALGLTIALKIEMLYLGLFCAWLVWRRHGWHFRRYVPALGLAVGALVVATPWYLHAYWLARNSIDVFGVFGGLYGGHDKFQTLTMLASPAWYYEMWERIRWELLSGTVGFALAAAGLLTIALSRSGGLILAYLVTLLAYFVTVAEGQLDAAYRQLHAVPPLAALIGFGALGLVAALSAAGNRFPITLSKLFRWSPTMAAFIAIALVTFTEARRVDQILEGDSASPLNEQQWRIAGKVKQFAGENALIVTLGEYTIHKGGVDVSPVLYRYANARGWSLVGSNWSSKQIDELRAKGAVLFVGTNLDREPFIDEKVQQLAARYRMAYTDQGTVILDLRDPL